MSIDFPGFLAGSPTGGNVSHCPGGGQGQHQPARGAGCRAWGAAGGRGEGGARLWGPTSPAVTELHARPTGHLETHRNISFPSKSEEEK